MRALRYTGVAMVEFKVNAKTGEFVLIEINGRFWGSLPLAVAAGANFPLWLYQMWVENREDFSGETENRPLLPQSAGGLGLVRKQPARGPDGPDAGHRASAESGGRNRAFAHLSRALRHPCARRSSTGNRRARENRRTDQNEFVEISAGIAFQFWRRNISLLALAAALAQREQPSLRLQREYLPKSVRG